MILQGASCERDYRGLLIGLGLAFVLERLDRRIGGPEDLEAIYRLPMLGVVPESAALSRSARPKAGARAVLPTRYGVATLFGLVRLHHMVWCGYAK